MSGTLLKPVGLVGLVLIASFVPPAQQAEPEDGFDHATKEFEAAVDHAVTEYVAKLSAVAKELAAKEDFDEAKRITDLRKALEEHGISTMPDPTKKNKRILLRNRFRTTNGADLEFRPDYTAYGHHNGLTTNWVMTDPQTLITGATTPQKPVYIYKFDKTLTQGTVYKYRPVTDEKRHTVTRARR